MAENKRAQRIETVEKNRIGTPVDILERRVNQIKFHNTRTSDGTFAMRSYVAGLIDFAGQDGVPTSLHFYVTKNENQVNALNKQKHLNRKTHLYFKCNNCKANLRVPKGKGKIEVTCPKCKFKMIKHS